MSLSLPEVTIPSFQTTPFQVPQNSKGIIIIGDTLTEKSSMVMKIARYIVLLASHILPVVSAAQKLEINAIQRSYNGAGALETFFNGESTADGFAEGVIATQADIANWYQATITSRELALSLTTQGIAIVEKFDDFLWAGENFGLGENNLSIGIHAIAYGGTVFLMIKNYIELAQSIDKAKTDPDTASLVRLKYAKFTLATGAAVLGLITLFSKAAAYSVLWVIFAAGTTTLSLADYVIEKTLDPDKKEREAIKKAYIHPTIDMAV